VLKYLDNKNLMDKIFNSYVYNLAEIKENIVTGESIDVREEVKDEEQENIRDLHMYFGKIRRNQITEVAFMLSTLLNGKRRTELQFKLLNFEFVNLLKSLLKEIIWKLELPVS